MTDVAAAGSGSVLGTYADGRELRYDESSGRFDIGGTPVSIEHVHAYDAAGHINWAQGASRAWFHQSFPAQAATQPAGAHAVPKCLHCGYEGPWRVEPLLRPIDWILTIVFLFLWGGGLIYLLIVLIVRSDENRRAKLCANCGARNMFTFQY